MTQTNDPTAAAESAFKATLAGRVADADAVIAGLDLARFTTADGTADTGAIDSLVNKLFPASAVPPSRSLLPQTAEERMAEADTRMADVLTSVFAPKELGIARALEGTAPALNSVALEDGLRSQLGI